MTIPSGRMNEDQRKELHDRIRETLLRIEEIMPQHIRVNDHSLSQDVELAKKEIKTEKETKQEEPYSFEKDLSNKQK